MDKVAKRGVYVLIALYLVLAAYHSVVNPLCETSDEFWHIGFVVHLARGGGLPVQRAGQETPWRQEGSQPPLYYWLQAQVARALRLPVEAFAEACPRNPHAYLGDATRVGNRNLSLHGPWQTFPWKGTVLTIHVWRLVSVLMGALVVLGTYNLAHTLFPGQPGWAFGAAFVVALNPMFLFVTSGVTNDALVNAVAALTLWHLAHVWQHGLTARRAAWGGLLLAAAALSKLSGLTLWPLAVLTYLAAGRRQGWKKALGLSGLALGIAVAVSGWWYWRNWVLYRDPTGLNVMLDIVGRRQATWADLLAEWEGFRRAFWGVFGGMNVLMPAGFYVFFDLWAALSLVGFALYMAHLAHKGSRQERVVWMAVLGYIGVVFVGVVRWTMQTLASQGRLLFPALPATALVLWAGWEYGTQWVPWRRLRSALRGVPVAALALAATLAPVLWIAPVYNPLRWQVKSPPPTAVPVTASFGNTLRLLAYETEPQDILLPGETLKVTLYWEQSQPAKRAWSLFVHLVDDVGIIVTQEDRYPVQGLLSTRHIPAGFRWRELVVLRVPATAVTPATLHLQVGFYDLKTGERLPVAGPPEAAMGDYLRVGQWALRPRPGAYPNATSYVFGEAVELVGFEMSPRVLRAGDTLTLTLYWRCLRPLAPDYTVFTHILEPPQTIWGQHDKAPAVPTSRCRAGEVYREVYSLTLKPDTPPGFYELEIGWYRPDTGERLRGEDGRTFLFVGRVRVVP